MEMQPFDDRLFFKSKIKIGSCELKQQRKSWVQLCSFALDFKQFPPACSISHMIDTETLLQSN